MQPLLYTIVWRIDSFLGLPRGKLVIPESATTAAMGFARLNPSYALLPHEHLLPLGEKAGMRGSAA